LSGDSDEERRCLAENLRCDDRVSKAREQALDSFVAQARPSKDDLFEALRTYHKKRVRAAANPDYLRKDLNAENRIRLRNLDIPLTTLVDITGLELVFEWARSRVPAFATYPSGAEKAFQWIRARLDAPGAPQFASLIMEVVSKHGREVRPFGPVWVTPQSDFEAVADHPCERWLEVLGVRKARRKLCVMILTYRARQVGTLYRPTQLDAGPCGDHFPSPSRLGAVSGHPVDLSAERSQVALKREMIHAPIDLKRDLEMHLERSSRWYGFFQKTQNDVPKRALERGVHLELLEREYGGDDVRAWFFDAQQEAPGNER
jgi:hypothetical protein